MSQTKVWRDYTLKELGEMVSRENGLLQFRFSELLDAMKHIAALGVGSYINVDGLCQKPKDILQSFVTEIESRKQKLVARCEKLEATAASHR